MEGEALQIGSQNNNDVFLVGLIRKLITSFLQRDWYAYMMIQQPLKEFDYEHKRPFIRVTSTIQSSKLYSVDRKLPLNSPL